MKTVQLLVEEVFMLDVELVGAEGERGEGSGGPAGALLLQVALNNFMLKFKVMTIKLSLTGDE